MSRLCMYCEAAGVWDVGRDAQYSVYFLFHYGWHTQDGYNKWFNYSDVFGAWKEGRKEGIET
jgi:hypothetical protein